MSFTRAKPAGWATLEQITPAQINQIDTNQSNAIDGAAGGEYTNSAPIGIGGSLISRNGGEIVVQSGAALTASAGSSVQFGADARLVDGADISLEENSEIKSLNARECVIRCIPLYYAHRVNTGPVGGDGTLPLDWQYANISGAYEGRPTQTSVAGSASSIVFPVPALPSTATITEVSMTIDPSSGHAGLPGVMPSLTLMRYSGTTYARTIAGAITDGSASVVAYEAIHDVVLSLSQPVTEDMFAIHVRGEYSTNAVDLLALLRIGIKYTTARVNHQHHEYTLA